MIRNKGLVAKLGRVLALQVGLISLAVAAGIYVCLLYTSPSPRDSNLSRMPSSA